MMMIEVFSNYNDNIRIESKKLVNNIIKTVYDFEIQKWSFY
jgi:hypothetical protein